MVCQGEDNCLGLDWSQNFSPGTHTFVPKVSLPDGMYGVGFFTNDNKVDYDGFSTFPASAWSGGSWTDGVIFDQNFGIDRVAPKIWGSHSPIEPLTDQEVTLTGEAEDPTPGSGVKTIWIYLNNTGNLKKTCDNLNAPAGQKVSCSVKVGPFRIARTYKYYIRAKDIAGNYTDFLEKSFKVTEKPPPPPPPKVSPCPSLGDVDGDGLVEYEDALLIAGGGLTQAQKNRADVNGDGEITITDALLITQYLVNLIDIFPGCPDLISQNLKISGKNRWDEYVEGSQLIFSGTIKNIGGFRAESSTSRFELLGKGLTWDRTTSALNPGASESASASWQATSGTYQFRLCADVKKVVPETNDEAHGINNNCALSLPFTVQTKPDLVAQNLKLKGNLVAGQNITLSGDIKNIGGSTAGSSNTRFYIDGSSIGDNSTGVLSSDSIETEERTWTATSGSHTFKLCADISNQVAESNEDNNCAEISFEITPPTCTVTPGSNQLQGCYYENINFSAPSVSAPNGPSLSSPVPDSAWALDLNPPSPPSPPGPDWFSGRFEGDFTFKAGTYTFYLGSDDGGRFYLDGTEKINRWFDTAWSESSYSHTFASQTTARVKLEYYQKGGGARWSLKWEYTPINNILNVGSSPVTGIPISGSQSRTSGTTNYTVKKSTDINTTLTAPSSVTIGGIYYNFDYWSGCDSVSGPKKEGCKIKVTGGGTKTVTASYFEPLPIWKEIPPF